MTLLLILLLWAVISFGTLLPLVWILRLWLSEQTVEAPLAITGLLAHLIILAVLGVRHLYLLAGYCLLLLGLIAATPWLNRYAERDVNEQYLRFDIEKYQRLLERHPENSAIHAALAEAYLACRQYEEAIAEFEQAIALESGPCYVEKKRLRQAREMMARQDAPRFPWERWGRALRKKNDVG